MRSRLRAGRSCCGDAWRPGQFLRMGFSESEIAGFDARLVDAVPAWGDLDTIVGRIREDHAAGADQVVLRLTGAAEYFDIWLHRFAEALLP